MLPAPSDSLVSSAPLSAPIILTSFVAVSGWRGGKSESKGGWRVSLAGFMHVLGLWQQCTHVAACPLAACPLRTIQFPCARVHAADAPVLCSKRRQMTPLLVDVPSQVTLTRTHSHALLTSFAHSVGRAEHSVPHGTQGCWPTGRWHHCLLRRCVRASVHLGRILDQEQGAEGQLVSLPSDVCLRARALMVWVGRRESVHSSLMRLFA